ncbi:MAG: site-specific DNA-methyltransferase [Bacilli bacterium]|nr:site-specific DNA-methyltransferase [Bacilli bacterium]
MLYNDDCIKVLKTIEADSIDMIFADPPYFLSNDGLTINSGKIVSVNKGEWDKPKSYQSTVEFTRQWLSECWRVLKDNSTIWVTGTSHNIFEVHFVMKEIGFNVINIIIWHKIDPPPLIFKNKFKFSYEFIIWAKKGKRHYFNYDYVYSINNEEMHDVWNLPTVQMYEKRYGKHPTQKPECLLERIILCSTQVGDLVLDPFMGSGTTCVVAKRLKRKYIGIEKDVKYYEIAKRRLYEHRL